MKIIIFLYDSQQGPVNQSAGKDHYCTILYYYLSHAGHGTQYAIFNGEYVAAMKS